MYPGNGFSNNKLCFFLYSDTIDTYRYCGYFKYSCISFFKLQRSSTFIYSYKMLIQELGIRYSIFLYDKAI